MKKLIVILFLSLSTAGLFAQNGGNRSLEITGGAGFKFGPKFTSSLTFNKLYPLADNIKIGWGAGLRLGNPVIDVVTRITDCSSEQKKQSMTEADIPLYFRFNYETGKVYINCDLGYSLGLIAMSITTKPVGVEAVSNPHYCGLFVEPRFGYSFSEKYSAALGLLVQHAKVTEKTIRIADDEVFESSVTRRLFLPALTLRLAKHF